MPKNVPPPAAAVMTFTMDIVVALVSVLVAVDVIHVNKLVVSGGV